MPFLRILSTEFHSRLLLVSGVDVQNMTPKRATIFVFESGKLPSRSSSFNIDTAAGVKDRAIRRGHGSPLLEFFIEALWGVIR